MPEAAVYEYGHTLTHPYEVGFAGQRLMPTPAPNRVLPQLPSKFELSARIPGRTDCGHVARAARCSGACSSIALECLFQATRPRGYLDSTHGMRRSALLPPYRGA